MPRVNRDLQRRLAARRERERRRPTERRYNFATTEPELIDAVDADTTTTDDVDALDDDTADNGVATSPSADRAPASARATRTPSSTATSSLPSSTRGASRSTYRPFSDYKQEYAYVYRDLRRVAAVVGGLLIALLILYFALPILVH